MAGIYLHVPFCKQACNYCDFYFSTVLGSKEAVIDAMVQEIELRRFYLDNNKINSIYLGGGTPSLLSETELNLLFKALGKCFTWDTGIEITLEANPDDIDVKSVQKWKALGINRLSIGLQSFDNNELRWMNRAHNAEESLSSVKLAQDAGFDNISIDLIFGTKFQTLKSWEETLHTAVALRTQHISAYNLTIENKTELGLKNHKGIEPSVDEALSSTQFLAMLTALEAAGFEQYEISNFAKPGYMAVHNSNYWRQQNYLGIGPSAHSFDGVSRQWNVKNNAMYSKAIKAGEDFFEREVLSLNDRYNEYVMTRLRTIWGCDPAEIKKLFGEGALTHFKKQLTPYQNCISEVNGKILLNKEGRLKADGIASDLFLV
jgi:oxygen-independent coproporphyrinogen III oxidase